MNSGEASAAIRFTDLTLCPGLVALGVAPFHHDQQRCLGVSAIARVAPRRPEPRPRSLWRQVAVPTEHGGWGLTLEPAVLGLLLSFSWAGVAIALAALLTFVLRTPVKVVLVDRRRGRAGDRTRMAARIATAEALILAGLIVFAVRSAGLAWVAFPTAALPLVAVELWFDARSRSRRLLPELAGACAMASVAASIVVAGGAAVGLAIAAWLLATARAIMSIAFVRTQIDRLHGRSRGWRTSDRFQAAGVAVGWLAVAADARLAAGAGAVSALGVVQLLWVRRQPPKASVLGATQMVLGLVVVVIAAAGAHVMS
ncbi:MAG: YwiC-like family protein [Acidimicrobiia bacterium]|nr:YwiC-like family protein [Acidimicrobiia bacterium]